MTRVPAGYYVANELIRHVCMAGCSIVCTACGAEGRLPLPRAEGYGRAVEDFLERHRLCQAASIPSAPTLRGLNRGAA